MYILPAVVVFGLTLFFPLFYTISISLTDKTIGKQQVVFIGLTNYIELFTKPRFLFSVVRSLLFTVLAVSVKFALGMIVALYLNKKFYGRNLVRALAFLPWTIPWFTTAILFLWLFGFTGGVNRMLQYIGCHSIFWLGPDLALFSGVIANAWKGFPFFMISFLAGLQAIPKELYEAAAVDGANAWQQFWHVTLPGLRNVILITTALSSIWTFGQLELLYIMTRGGPADASMVLPILIYETGVRRYSLSEASAMGVLCIPIILAGVWIIARQVRREA